ncbi:hypothetical protein GA0074695_4267 [Micromonospora viridifaciens]|uniref:Trypsin-like peptidase domain-containing protein n=1 Tax=Micromonospora viridifaciens TaxID=1881 RepID=A0A1C4YGT2_MICVI|nr:hypothetical protein [Micromonospora viridifaciens]SCF19927.1 hypothetical protein GA0074695_4267 [Micromonospora viridifaciens]
MLQAGLITGIGFGLRDEEAVDPDDLALRIFVADAESVPEEVQTVIDTFPFPVVVIQRVFEFTAQLPDTSPYRPIMGGTSVATSRLPIAGTLGAIVQDASDPSIFYGLSNFHVLCVDPSRAKGDPIVQPEPSPLGSLPGDRIGTLDHWSFPENTLSGPVDAAVCRLERDSVPEIVDIGPVFGTIAAEPGTLVTKRGRSTGQTFGIVTDTKFSVALDYPAFPAVGSPPTTFRIFTNQIQMRPDFPKTIVFGEQGDSGSLVVGPEGRAVGLYFGSGWNPRDPGDPIRYGVASPADVVATELGITF